MYTEDSYMKQKESVYTWIDWNKKKTKENDINLNHIITKLKNENAILWNRIR